MKYSTIRVNNDLKNELIKIKIDKKLKTVNDVIKMLLKKWKK